MLDDSAPWPVGTTHLHQYAPKPKDASILPLRKHIPPSKPRLIYRPEDDILVRSIPRSEPSTSEDSTPRLATRTLNQTGGCKTLNDLPTEIQECILDYTHGTLGSAACDGAGSGGVVRNWSRMMRHPRRKQLSDLSLVSSVWRRLIQQRMYRHSKWVSAEMS